MKFRLLLAWCAGPLAAWATPPEDAETVVLLHGLGRTRWSMNALAVALTRDGYRVVNLSYPSRSVPVEALANDWLPAQLRATGTAAASRLHFVTHSMGGIVLRVWRRDQPAPANLGRIVMIAPPNAGSAVSDRLMKFPPFRWFTGVNGRRLGTAAGSLPLALGPWPASTSAEAGGLGIIAGDRSLNPLFSSWLAGPDDGKVAVTSTHLKGESDHVVLHHSHTWLARHDDTAACVRRFLRTGKFQ